MGINKQSNRIGLLVTGAMTLLLCACSSVKPSTPPPEIVQLNKTAQKISTQIQVLRATTQATSHKNDRIYPIPQSGAMATQITLDWSGPLVPAVKSVAQLVGYHFEGTIGTPPPSPILVDVSAHKKPAFAVLQNIGWQAGKSVGVIVKPSKKLIAVTYNGHPKGAS